MTGPIYGNGRRDQSEPGVVKAIELRSGTWLRTRIGSAPVKSIEPKADGLEVVLDMGAEGSTRPPSQGSVLFFWPNDRVTIGRASAPRSASTEARLFGQVVSGGGHGRQIAQKG